MTNTYTIDGDFILLPTEGEVDLFALAAALGYDVDADDDTEAADAWERDGNALRLTGEFRGREFGALAIHTGDGMFAVRFWGPVWGDSKESGVSAFDVAGRLDIPRDVVDRAVASGASAPQWARSYGNGDGRAAAVRVLRSEEDYCWMGA